jgi:putative ABC transport system permease protein
MESLFQDLRFGIRLLRKNPGFTTIAVLTLALGIGANTLIFSLINGVVLRPLPFDSPGQLYDLWTNLSRFGREVASLPDFKDWRDQGTVFDQVAAYMQGSANLIGGPEPERVRYMRTTANLFSVLKLQPELGRNLVQDDDRPGAPKVAVLSHAFWKRKFGGEPNVLGQTVTLNTTGYTVVGVAPPEMQLFSNVDVIAPLGLDPKQEAQLNRRSDFLRVVARAKDGVPREQVEAQMQGIAARLEKAYPETNTGVGVLVVPLQKDLVGDIGPILLSMWAAVGFILLIACVNLANLLLARGAVRQKEIAIRAAMGARSGRLIRQMLTEGLIISLLGAAVGIVFSYWGLDAALAFAPRDFPFLSRVRLDLAVLGFALLLSVVTTLLFGLLPAVEATGTQLHGTLKEGGRTGASTARQALRRVLVISEVALSLVLLVGAGLMIRTVHQLQASDPGFNPENLLTFRVSLPPGHYDAAHQSAFFNNLISQLRVKPGVQSAAATSDLYVDDEPAYLTFALQGAPPLPPGQGIDAQIRAITPGYMETMQVPLLRGRQLAASDTATSKKVAVINQALVDRYFHGQDLMGRSVSLDGQNWYEVVGIVGNVKQRGAVKETYPEIDLPLEQDPTPAMTLVLRTSMEPGSLISVARQTISNLDPTLPVYAVQTMTDVMSQSRAPQQFQAWMLTAFAGLALLLAAVGIYGVMSQWVAQRTAEFGVRMALGARPAQLLKLVLGQGIGMAAVGTGVGVIGAIVLSRFMRSFLFGVSTYDPATLVSVCVVLLIVALLASYVPARRATKVDPMVALRYE